jgi:two-component system sensor histidine kinase DegS
MKSQPKPSIAATPLRRHAEARLREHAGKNQATSGAGASNADTRRLLHELQVHQIELEMQNEELKKARDEMEAGLEKYSELYDFAPVGYLTLDREGTICEANLAAASLLGIPRAPLVKQRLGLFVAPPDRPLYVDFLTQVFQSQGRQECDMSILVKDKPPMVVRIRANLAESGQACRVAVTDITLHKLAEAATAQLAAIVTSSSDAIIGNDLNSIITSWNAGAEKLFGYSAREMVGRPVAQLMPSDRQDEEARIMSRIRQGKSVEHFETVRVAKDGRRLDMSVTISPVRYAGGKIFGASKVARDITGQKLAADKLRVSEIRFRRLFETAHDGILLLDPGTRKITDANPLMTKLLGYSHSQLVGKELFEIGLLKDEAASQAMFQKLTRKHEVRYEDLPLKSQQGRHQEVEVVANLYEENGHAVIQCNIRDITKRKLAEDALRVARGQLAQHAGQLQRLVAQRTAELMATNRQLEVALASTRMGEEQNRVLLQESQDMQKKLRHLTHQILTAQEEERKKISRELHDEVVQMLVGLNVELSALVHGNSPGVHHLKDKIAHTQRLVEKSVDSVHRFARDLRPAVLDDLGLIPALHAFCRNLAARKNIKIAMTAFGGVETLESDKRTVLFRVAQEALTNIARHARATRVKLIIIKIPDAVQLEVVDNGKAFSVRKILLAKNNKRLGLVGMKERVEMVGGNLTIESVSGKGTTVRAKIPFCTPPPEGQ